MKNGSMDRLVAKMRQTLQQNKAIAVVGWRDSDHDDFSRSLSAEQVVFVGNVVPPQVARYVLLTETVTGLVRDRATSGRSSWQTLLETKEVHQALGRCKDMLKIRPPANARAAAPDVVKQQGVPDAPPSGDMPDGVLDIMTRSYRELTAMEKFVKAFLEAAKKDGGTVSSHTLTQLIREHDLSESPQTLAKKGFVEGKVADGGERITRYAAGPKMVEIDQTVELVPSEPLARAQYVISKESALLGEKEQLEKRLAEVTQELEVIGQAKEFIGKLEKLFGQS
jgi:hypothetical protein